jgi:hypothetical protein
LWKIIYYIEHDVINKDILVICKQVVGENLAYQKTPRNPNALNISRSFNVQTKLFNLNGLNYLLFITFKMPDKFSFCFYKFKQRLQKTPQISRVQMKSWAGRALETLNCCTFLKRRLEYVDR